MWKDVVGFEGLYEVSDTGQVRSLDRIARSGRFCKGKILSQKSIRGYMNVTLCVDNKLTTRQVHRLVMMAFSYNPEYKKLQVNHINGVKDDNRLENLEWCTSSENLKHAYQLGLERQDGEHNANHKLTWEKVYKIRNEYCHLSETQVAQLVGCNRATVGQVRRYETWKE